MKKHSENHKDGIRESILFYSRWSWIFFAAFAVLVGWLGENYRAGNFDILFWAGVVAAAGTFALSAWLSWLAHRLIKQQRGNSNDRR